LSGLLPSKAKKSAISAEVAATFGASIWSDEIKKTEKQASPIAPSTENSFVFFIMDLVFKKLYCFLYSTSNKCTPTSFNKKDNF
jgi:hypothetical protein